MYEAIAHAIASGCTAWRSGDDEEGIHWFQQAALLWIEAIEQQEAAAAAGLASSGDATAASRERLPERLEQLAEALNGAIGRMRAGDYVAAADQLEYAVLPVLTEGGMK